MKTQPTEPPYEFKPGVKTYSLPWPGPSAPILPLDQVLRLCCSEKGCAADYRSPGGLKNINASFAPTSNWRCAKHRTTEDHSSHRLDLHQALERAKTGAKKEAEENLINFFKSMVRSPSDRRILAYFEQKFREAEDRRPNFIPLPEMKLDNS